MPIISPRLTQKIFLIFLFSTIAACPEPDTTQSNSAKLGGPCLHGVYCEPGLECVEGFCTIFQETNPGDAESDAGMPPLQEPGPDTGIPQEDLFEVCSELIGTWRIALESDGESTCGQNPSTQPYEVSLDAQGELQAIWDTTAGADEYEMTSEFLLIEGKCALKNDSIFIIHAPPMNDVPATDIQVDYHYTVIADGLTLSGNGTMHTSTTIVETGIAQQDCTQDILLSGDIETD